MRAVAEELNIFLIDLTSVSMEFFTAKGQEYTTIPIYEFPSGAL